jgi:hypothetical protein
VRELVNVTQDVSLLDPSTSTPATPRSRASTCVPEPGWPTAGRRAEAPEPRQAQQRQEQIQARPAQAAMIKARALTIDQLVEKYTRPAQGAISHDRTDPDA